MIRRPADVTASRADVTPAATEASMLWAPTVFSRYGGAHFVVTDDGFVGELVRSVLVDIFLLTLFYNVAYSNDLEA